ncbi:DUF2625 domain-containing protein [Pedobacter rhizosphaerae]|uniref:DUF2625 domain-containing protein n=1 Tax=Pedobacter rhizosphaerae TaxID=390241 RepID=A0A1H9K407_9SPHI|nr:DUF2625 domain-containing protein [Pedobacter rhizosphaerae]SEQ93820.1 Protein of unknown function DUF2625 [Pedobacter rhizosphaerae]
MKSIIKAFTIVSLSLFSITGYAQNKMQSVDELINKTDPAWPLVKKWIDSAKNKVEILELDSAKAKDALYNAQVSTYSTLGSIIYNTGGIMVDNGWIRILGSGSARLNRSVPEWNKGKTITEFGDKPDYLLVADDAAGGFFAINYGAFGADLKNVYYLAPNSLNWEPLGAGYSEFILFCFDSDLSKFYKGLRWSSWDQFIANLDGNKSYSFRPYLWAKEGTDIEKCTRKLVTTEELFKFNIGKQKELQAAAADQKTEKQ